MTKQEPCVMMGQDVYCGLCAAQNISCYISGKGPEQVRTEYALGTGTPGKNFQGGCVFLNVRGGFYRNTED
ncbi:MAG TPA: hypothetical protein PKG71_04220 [Candidatus Woesebacteria bacterium]|nr:hypothetical protein [Candidatus Woesebacteria bacterium]HNS95145.1 hypothetical protein [Candidatus Woesebacteria bacterium]